MAIGLIKNETSLFIKEETVEGTYVAPASASDALEVSTDYAGFSYEAESIERSNLTNTIEKVASRVGMASVAGEIPVELKANHVAGSAPYANVLYKSLLGGKHQLTSVVTTTTANTTTVLNMSAPNAALFKKGMVVKVNSAGAHELRPVSAVGATSITLAIPLSSAPADAVTIEKVTTYYHASGAPTFSATSFTGGKIENRATGLRSVSASIDGWETSSLPMVKFSTEGLNLTKQVGVPAYSPNFGSDALPPVILGACAYVGGVEVDYSSFTLSIENTKAEMLSACQDSGKIGSRFTALSIKGEINPYMDDANVNRFTNFKANADTSVFIFAANPSTVAGEIKEAVAFWVPQAKITALTEEDSDGVMVDKIAFESFRKDGGDSIFCSFI